MNEPARDRDGSGRARNARPRDELGRPLPHGAQGVSPDPELAELEAADPVTLLAGAQRLLDDRRPFEAHELLEAAWKRAPQGERELWRALAQLAVGLTHQLRGNETGARALFGRGAEALQSYPEPVPYGIDAAGLVVSSRRLQAGEPDVRLRLTR
jgi:uncharacterized protein